MLTKKNIVIASHSLSEAITSSVIKNRANLQVDVSIVLLQELVSDYEIFDELSDSSKVIRWYGKGNACISNKSHVLLNRVLFFPRTYFQISQKMTENMHNVSLKPTLALRLMLSQVLEIKRHKVYVRRLCPYLGSGIRSKKNVA